MIITSAKEIQRSVSLRLPDVGRISFPWQHKLHNYAKYEDGVDYQFEAIDPLGEKGYITLQGRGIRVGDRLLLTQDDQPVQYQIEKIDYYSCPSDMCISLVSKVKS